MWASPIILLALLLSFSVQHAVIIGENLCQRVVRGGPGAVGISLYLPVRADAALLQPVTISPWKINVWITCVSSCAGIPSAHFVSLYRMRQLQPVLENKLKY